MQSAYYTFTAHNASRSHLSTVDYAIQHNLTPFISMQNHYSAVYREEEREMFPALKMFGVGSIPWSPLGRGVLTRPLSEQTKRSNSDVYVHVLSSPQRMRGLTCGLSTITRYMNDATPQIVARCVCVHYHPTRLCNSSVRFLQG